MSLTPTKKNSLPLFEIVTVGLDSNSLKIIFLVYLLMYLSVIDFFTYCLYQCYK